MDETSIQAELAKKANEISPPVPVNPAGSPYPDPPAPEPRDEAFHNQLPLEDMVAKGQLMDYFEIPQAARYTPETANWVNKIMEWAKDESKSSNIPDLMRVIREQETIMGSRYKEQRVFKLYSYVRIHEQRKALAERERALYG